MKKVKNILDVIDLDALNTYNSEIVEEGYPPLSIWDAYVKVSDAIDNHASALREDLVEKAYGNIDRFIDDNYLCYGDSDLGYVDNGLFVTAIAQKVRKTLF